MLEVEREIRDFLRKRIDEHRDTFDGDNVRDFVDLYLKTEQSEEESGAFSGKYTGDAFVMLIQNNNLPVRLHYRDDLTDLDDSNIIYNYFRTRYLFLWIACVVFFVKCI